MRIDASIACRFAAIAASAVLSLAHNTSARIETFPMKTVKLVVPAPPGKMLDVLSSELTLLFVNSHERNPDFPNAPASAEVVNDFVHADWFAIAAPPKTSSVISEALLRAISEILTLPDVAQRLKAFAVTPVASSPAKSAKFIDTERGRLRQVIAASGMHHK